MIGFSFTSDFTFDSFVRYSSKAKFWLACNHGSTAKTFPYARPIHPAMQAIVRRQILKFPAF